MGKIRRQRGLQYLETQLRLHLKRRYFFYTGRGGGYGHTGIVCHVFENGSILFVEQNTPLSGWDQFKTPYTWNYRIWTKSQQQEQVISFAYPDDREAKLSSN